MIYTTVTNGQIRHTVGLLNAEIARSDVTIWCLSMPKFGYELFTRPTSPNCKFGDSSAESACPGRGGGGGGRGIVLKLVEVQAFNKIQKLA